MTHPSDPAAAADALIGARALYALTNSPQWAALVADLEARVAPKPLPWWRQAWLPWTGLAVALAAVGLLVAVVAAS